MRATVFAYPATLTRDAARRFLVRFPDIPEALTDGATEEEALREAADALSEALMRRTRQQRSKSRCTERSKKSASPPQTSRDCWKSTTRRRGAFSIRVRRARFRG